jgi:phytoene dehydrogenase-like protein
VSESFDIVTVGSGHNGLVAAAYLAVAGRKVLVLERNAWFGGVVTRELTVPGFRHDQHSMAHIFIQANPLLLDDELKLKARYGLRHLFPDPPVTSLFEDGETLSLYRDRERTWSEIARFSRSDADAYRRLSEQAASWLPMIAAKPRTTHRSAAPPADHWFPPRAFGCRRKRSPRGRRRGVAVRLDADPQGELDGIPHR